MSKDKTTSKTTSRFNHRLYEDYMNMKVERDVEDINFQINFEGIGYALKEWQEKLDEGDPRYQKLDDLMGNVNNIFIHTMALRRKLDAAIVQSRKNRKEYLNACLERNELREKVQLLEKEIEFYERYGSQTKGGHHK